MPVRHENHPESDCDRTSSPQNGYQRFNEAALKTLHGKKHVKLSSLAWRSAAFLRLAVESGPAAVQVARLLEAAGSPFGASVAVA